MSRGKHLVGVDIGSSAIKVCQMQETRKGLSVVALGYVPLDPQTVVDGHIMNAGTVVQGIQKIFQEKRIRDRKVALGVSGQSVIIRKVVIPMMTAAELEEQIQWEAEQHIPFDIRDVHIDYQVLRRRPESGQMDLLLVAAKRDEINDYAQLAREAKLNPVVVDVDVFAVQNLFELVNGGLSPSDTSAIVNVGANLSSLNVLHEGVSVFTRDIANGGASITEELQKQLAVPYAQAEAYKKGGDDGGIVPKTVVEIVASVCDALAAEIQRSLDFFMAMNAELRISKVYLTGGSANLPQLGQAIERRVHTPVEVFSPFQNLTLAPSAADEIFLRQYGMQMAVSLGLALRKDKEKNS